jgi:glucokinase
LAKPSTFPRLLGDIGGTNVRFALQRGAGAALTDPATSPCAAHASLQQAMEHYLSTHGGVSPRWCAIGIANPIVGDEVHMTNRDWSFSIAALQRALGFDRFLVLNDFTALALALPALAPSELRRVGGRDLVAQAPMGLIGPGTGLGVSGLLPAPDGRGYVPINGEGGHVTLAATDEFEEAVLRGLRRRYGHVSAERALSGPGLVNLYEVLCEIDGVASRGLDASGVTSGAVAGDDRQCIRAVALFFSFLGNVAGNLALTLGARGGMYIGGGIVPRLGDRIDGSDFRSQFEAKGRFRDYLAPIPVFVVNARTSPALVGAARALDDL